jgi:TrmH family RNA methyltransferase
VGRRGARQDEGRFVIEGPTLVAEAVAANVELEAVYVGVDVVARITHDQIPVAAGVLERVLDTVSPQAVAAIAPIRWSAVADVVAASTAASRPVVVLDRVSDPGNAGTILRAAEAAGCVGIVVTPGSVDPWGPKTVRAAAGAVFRVPVAETPDLAALAALDRVGTAADAGTVHLETDLTGPVAFVVGNEAHGLDPDAEVDRWVRIEMDGPTESLNVAMATTVLVFEALRQRHARVRRDDDVNPFHG